jgi:hypothetical protein
MVIRTRHHSSSLTSCCIALVVAINIAILVVGLVPPSKRNGINTVCYLPRREHTRRRPDHDASSSSSSSSSSLVSKSATKWRWAAGPVK